MIPPDSIKAARLTRMTGLALDVSLSRLKSASRARDSLERQLASLDADRRAVSENVDSAATRAGADLLWHRWADSRRADLNMALARAHAEENRARRAAARAFGRDQALAEVLARARRSGR